MGTGFNCLKNQADKCRKIETTKNDQKRQKI